MQTKMKRVTIYVEESIWNEIKKCAWKLSSAEKRISVGNYLVQLHKKKFEGMTTDFRNEDFSEESGKIPEKIFKDIKTKKIPIIDTKRKVKKVIKKEKIKSAWVNPLIGTSLAPK